MFDMFYHSSICVSLLLYDTPLYDNWNPSWSLDRRQMATGYWILMILELDFFELCEKLVMVQWGNTILFESVESL